MVVREGFMQAARLNSANQDIGRSEQPEKTDNVATGVADLEPPPFSGRAGL